MTKTDLDYPEELLLLRTSEESTRDSGITSPKRAATAQLERTAYRFRGKSKTAFIPQAGLHSLPEKDRETLLRMFRVVRRKLITSAFRELTEGYELERRCRQVAAKRVARCLTRRLALLYSCLRRRPVGSSPTKSRAQNRLRGILKSPGQARGHRKTVTLDSNVKPILARYAVDSDDQPSIHLVRRERAKVSPRRASEAEYANKFAAAVRVQRVYKNYRFRQFIGRQRGDSLSLSPGPDPERKSNGNCIVV